MISVNQLTHQLISGEEALTVFKDLSFVINPSESVAITGSSGSGKTTLLSLLAGLDVPTAGSISLMNQDITQLNEDQRARFRAEHVGFVFQSFHLLQGLTAQENVALPLELRGDDDASDKALEFLASVGLDHRISHYPHQLSGGEQQRVALARAFCVEPDILFADEPTGNLDQQTGARIIDLLFSLNDKCMTTLVLVTHEERLAECCGRQFNLAGGELVEVYRA